MGGIAEMYVRLSTQCYARSIARLTKGDLASMIRLSKDEMARMNKTSIALKDGTGYIGYLETLHMLHCVVSCFPRRQSFPSTC